MNFVPLHKRYWESMAISEHPNNCLAYKPYNDSLSVSVSVCLCVLVPKMYNPQFQSILKP